MQLLNLLNSHHLKKLIDEGRTVFFRPQEHIEKFVNVILQLLILCEFTIVIVGDQFIEQVISLHATSVCLFLLYFVF